jgi:hypothetical protein
VKRVWFILFLAISAAAAVEEPAMPAVEKSAETAATVKVPDEFLPAYFSARPARYLIDPQNLLGTKDFQSRLDFLNYHASDSAIDFYIYVFAGDQQIPVGAEAADIGGRLFNNGRPAVVAYYFLGAPDRAIFHLSPTLAAAIPETEQRRAQQSSVMVALENLDAASQLDAFAVQMSIRIYWMERLLGEGEKPMAAAAPVREQTVSKKHSLERIKVEALAFYEKWGSAALAGVLTVGLSGLLIWRRLRGIGRFPDLEVEPRLGGAHCAGVGAVISFASSSVTPASQKDQVPDYLRRA